MIKRATLFFFIALIFTSCKQKREDIIARKWQEVAMTNAQMDEVMRSQKAFIDTVGMHTTTAENMRDYGVTNVDSFKRLLQMNMDSFSAAQKRAIDATIFDFRPGGIVYMHTDGGLDSAAWSFEEDGMLLLDEQKLAGVGTQLHVEVITLTDTVMNLKFMENNSSSNAIFKPAKK